MKEKRYSYWIYSGFFSGIQKLSVPIFGILSTIILAHKLQDRKEMMGEWGLFLVIAGFTEVLRSGLVKNSLIKFLNDKDVENHKHIRATTFFLNMVITTVIGLIFFFLGKTIGEILNAKVLDKLLLIYIAGLLFILFFSHFEWVLIAKKKFSSVFWGYFARQLVAFTSICFYVFSVEEIKLEWLAVFYCIGIGAGVIVMYFNVRVFLTNYFRIRYEWVKKIFSFGKYTFGTNISSQVFRSTDQFIVSSIPHLGTEVVAGQNIAARITNILDLPSQVLADLIFPKSAEHASEGNFDKVKYFYERSVGASLAVIFPVLVGIFIFAKPTMSLFGGSKYFYAIPYLRIMLVNALLLPFLKQFGTTMDSTGKPQINFFVSFLMAIFNIAFCALIIPKFGLAAAGVSLLICYLAAFFLGQFYLNKYYNIKWARCFYYSIQVYKWGARKIFLKKSP